MLQGKLLREFHVKTYPCIESLCEQGVRVIAPTAAEDNPHILTSRVRTSRSVASGSPPQMCSCLVHRIKFVLYMCLRWFSRKSMSSAGPLRLREGRYDGIPVVRQSFSAESQTRVWPNGEFQHPFACEGNMLF